MNKIRLVAREALLVEYNGKRVSDMTREELATVSRKLGIRLKGKKE